MQTVSYSKILVPLDGSEVAAGAIKPAVEIALAFKAQLVLVRVVTEFRGTALEMDEVRVVGPLRKVAQDYLEKVQAELVPQGVQPDARVRVGDAAHEVLEAASELGADLIVMSSHGRTGVSRFLFGSVAEKVVKHATCPVLVVRA